ncbi:NAD(P)H-dependent flavin oxidoreductase [Chitinimonas lacunae]|uniref:Propionate 3-nitronate monooxygenase n=1 Tax=Chitinimonas lacunae TaxID=1963018 RepID=A0ABV8MMR6_9NEIS
MNPWPATDFTRRLGLRLPVVQGPFGGGLSSVELTAAVSEAGGLGSFGAHHLDAAAIRDTAAAIRQRTGRPFALNLWIPHEQSDAPPLDDQGFDGYLATLAPYFQELGVALPTRPARFMPPYQEQVEALLAVRPAVFSFVFGIPAPEILQRCRELEITTVGAATTVDEACALEQAGVDMVVATGFEAGGHRVSFLRRAEDSLTGTFALIPQVADAVHCPVIAAGGIADGRGVAAALTLGAAAAQIGTAFLACRESNASALHRERLFSPDARHTGLTRAFSGRLARSIRNRLMEEVKQSAPYPIQNWLTARLRPAATEQGRADLMSLWAGQAAPLLRHRDAATLLAALQQETLAALGRFGR